MMASFELRESGLDSKRFSKTQEYTYGCECGLTALLPSQSVASAAP